VRPLDQEVALELSDVVQQLTDEAAAKRGVATSAIGPDNAPEAAGAAMRDPILANEAAARAHESEQHEAVDPDGTLGMDATPIGKAARDILKQQTPSAAPLTGP
jgi:hypothetical protein